jgi:hypothetical protein
MIPIDPQAAADICPITLNKLVVGCVLSKQKRSFFQKILNFYSTFLNVKKKAFLTEILEKKENTVFSKTCFSKNSVFLLIIYPSGLRQAYFTLTCLWQHQHL